MRMRNVVYFVNDNSHIYSASVTAMLCGISCYMGLHYNGTWLYCIWWQLATSIKWYEVYNKCFYSPYLRHLNKWENQLCKFRQSNSSQSCHQSELIGLWSTILWPSQGNWFLKNQNDNTVIPDDNVFLNHSTPCGRLQILNKWDRHLDLIGEESIFTWLVKS